LQSPFSPNEVPTPASPAWSSRVSSHTIKFFLAKSTTYQEIVQSYSSEKDFRQLMAAASGFAKNHLLT